MIVNRRLPGKCNRHGRQRIASTPSSEKLRAPLLVCGWQGGFLHAEHQKSGPVDLANNRPGGLQSRSQVVFAIDSILREFLAACVFQ